MTLEQEKKRAIREWWWKTYPLDVVRYATAWLVYPFAELLQVFLPNNNPLWWWLDDEIKHESSNADWKTTYNNLPKFLKYYLWHIARNPMWNLRASLQPQIGREQGVYNNEIVVRIVKDTLMRNGEKVDWQGSLYYEEAIWKWINAQGQEGWNVHRGVKVSWKYSTTGELHYWYRPFIGGKLYFRRSVAEIRSQWGFTTKFPFIGKSDYYINIKKGATNKGFVNTNKRKKVKND